MIAVVCTCFLAVLALLIPPHAPNAEVNLNTKLENGRSLRDLRDLIDVGLGLRADTLTEDAKGQNVVLPLADKLGIDMPRESLAGMLRFFMRGAVPFPMMTESASYVVFMNPVADSVLLTSWVTSEGKVLLESARLVTSETLEGSEHSALTARWTNTDAKADTLWEVVQKAQELTAHPKPSDLKRVEDIFRESQAKHVLPIRRITAAALGTSEKNIACVGKLLSLGTNIKSLSLAADKTNISRETADTALLPAGGIQLDDITLLVYSSKEQPGNFVFAGADQSKDCALFSLNGVKTINF